MKGGITPKGSHGVVSMAVKGQGQYCTYCKRELIAYSHTHPTRDHVLPRSKGGRKTVWCCVTCNGMKADMLPGEWETFMRCNPGWWQLPGLGARLNKERVAAVNRFQVEGRPSRRGIPVAATKPVGKIPATVPLAYPDDPKRQAAFEHIYKNRLYLLRTTDASI